jgi:hypothetical protein
MINVPKGQMPPPSSMGSQKIPIDKTTSILCEKCASDLFIPAFYMRKLSALIAPDGKDSVIPIQTFCCGNCGHINKEFIPIFMQAEAEAKEKESTLVKS